MTPCAAARDSGRGSYQISNDIEEWDDICVEAEAIERVCDVDGPAPYNSVYTAVDCGGWHHTYFVQERVTS